MEIRISPNSCCHSATSLKLTGEIKLTLVSTTLNSLPSSQKLEFQRYRNIADSIFVKLMEGESQYATTAQVYLKQHINKAVSELIDAERSLELSMNDDQEL
jgi:hypothetical protein